MPILTIKKTNPRYERKALIENSSYPEILKQIKTHPAIFQEIHHKRTINNIYLDSHDFKSFNDNITGNKNRVKTRIRWYGNLTGQIENPVLEIKIKQNDIGYKNTYPLKPFFFNKETTRKKITQIFQESALPKSLQIELANLNFSLLNTYTRQYFQSHDKKFRITLDQNLHFYKINPLHNHFHEVHKKPNTFVLEFKYSPEYENLAESITTVFPFQITKSSKYTEGILQFL